MENCIFPVEIIELIALCNRVVYLSISNTCKRLHGLLSIYRAMDKKLFIRRYVDVHGAYTLIRDMYWLNLGNVVGAPEITFWTLPEDQIIVIKLCKGNWGEKCENMYYNWCRCDTIIQYNWNKNDSRVGVQRRIIKSYKSDYIYETITPETTFDRELHRLINHTNVYFGDYIVDDILINRSYK